MRPSCRSTVMHRLFCAALTLCLLASVSSFLGIDAMAAINSGSYGAVRWSLNTSSGELKINGSGKIPDFVNSEPAWMKYCDSIKSVNIERGITRIGDNAFCYDGRSCPSLANLSLPVTLLSIGDHAFEGSALKEVSFPKQLKTVGSYAFFDTPLRKLELSGSVAELGMFAFSCTELTEAILPDGLEALETGLFLGCAALERIELNPGLRSVDLSAFLGCSSLNSLEFPDTVVMLGFGLEEFDAQDYIRQEEMEPLELAVSFASPVVPEFSEALDLILFAADELRSISISYPGWQGGWAAAVRSLGESGISFISRGGPEPEVKGETEILIPAAGASGKLAIFTLDGAQALSWSVSPACEGVSIDGNGCLRVTSLAADSIAGSLELTVSATFDGGNASTELVLRRDAPMALSLRLFRDGIELGDSDVLLLPGTGSREVVYEYALFDQYGSPMEAEVSWECTAADLDFEDGRLLLDSSLTGLSFELSVKAEGLCRDLKVRLCGIEFTGEPAQAPSPVYGADWDKLLDLSALGAVMDGDAVDGLFTLDVSGRPGAGRQGYTVYFLTDGGDRYEVCTGEVDIAPRPVCVTGLAASDKVYDGGSSAVITGAPALDGIIAGDEAALITGTAQFTSVLPAQGIAVSFSGFALSGSDAENYVLTQPVPVTADILPCPDFSDLSSTVQSSPEGSGDFELPRFAGMDGEPVSGELELSCEGSVLSAEEVSARLAALPVGSALEVSYSFKASGCYCGERSGLLSLRVSGLSFAGELVTADTPVYGDDWADILDLSGLSASRDGSAVDGSFSLDVSGGPRAGTQGYSVLFTDAQGNVSTVCTGSVDVAPRQLQVLGLTAADKAWDGTTEAALLGSPELSGLLDGDEVRLVTGTAHFASPDAGEDITVSFSGFGLEGPDADCYTLLQPGPVTADILRQAPVLPKELVIELTNGARSGSVDAAELLGLSADEACFTSLTPLSTEGALAAAPRLEGGRLIYTGAQEAAVGLCDVWELGLSGSACEGLSLRLRFVSAAPAQGLQLTGVTVSGKVYDGSPVTAEGSPRLLDTSGRSVTADRYTYVWSSSDGRVLDGPPSAAGSYVLRLCARASNGSLLCEREYGFRIAPAQIHIAADDVLLAPGDIVEPSYTVFGLAEGESLAEKPRFHVDAPVLEPGSYVLELQGAQVPDTGNYVEDIIYIPGRLVVLGSPPEFYDVAQDAWYREAVDYVCVRGIMNGVGDGGFAPDETATRAMLVTMLYRLAGEPRVRVSARYLDVDSSSWYSQAAAWAQAAGVAEGIGGGLFAPAMSVTRGQLATLLYRSVTGTVADGGSDMELALHWAVFHGLLQGRDGGALEPDALATRAEIAVIFARLMESGLCG